MDDKKQLEYIHQVKKLSDNDNLLLIKRRVRRNNGLMFVLYFSAIFFLIRTSMYSFMNSVNYSIHIKPFTIFQTSLILTVITLMQNLFIYFFFILALLLIFFMFESLNKNKDKEKKLMEKLNIGRH